MCLYRLSPAISRAFLPMASKADNLPLETEQLAHDNNNTIFTLNLVNKISSRLKQLIIVATPIIHLVIPGFFFFCIGVYNFGLSLYARYVFSLYRLTLFLNDCQPQANLEALIGRPHSMFNNNLLLLFSPSFTVTEENKRGSKEESSKYILRLFAVLFTHSFTYKQLPNATFL